MSVSSCNIKKKPNWFVLVLTGFGSIGWVGIMITVTFGLLSSPQKIDGEFMLILGFFLFAGTFVLKIFLWHLKGREQITITEQELIIAKKGTIFTIPRRFELFEINKICIANTNRPLRWTYLWGLSGGNIEILYFHQKKYFGQSIEKEQAKELIQQLETKKSNLSHLKSNVSSPTL
ncbi:MAG: hypothetical protein QMC68_01990 [Bacteroidia bacterium]|tara:strand:- start:66 stop:593 length:528 start_codon:yes stop_codon:yes gene_type:complete